MLDLLHSTFATVGIAGFAVLWVLKVAAGFVGLRWLRNRNTRRKIAG